MKLDIYQRRRIERGIAKAYRDCFSLLRECRDDVKNGPRSRLIRVAMHRDAIADRRRALESGETVDPTNKHYLWLLDRKGA